MSHFLDRLNYFSSPREPFAGDHGVTALALAFSVRLQTRNWAWLVISAIIDFILAAIVLSGWPGTAAWVIGLMVGINLLFSGLALIFAAMGADGRTPAA